MSARSGNTQKALESLTKNATPFLFMGVYTVAGLVEVIFWRSDIAIIASYVIGTANLLGIFLMGPNPFYILALLFFGYVIGMLFHSLWKNGNKARIALIALLILNSLCWIVVILPILRTLPFD